MIAVLFICCRHSESFRTTMLSILEGLGLWLYSLVARGRLNDLGWRSVRSLFHFICFRKNLIQGSKHLIMNELFVDLA